MNEGEYEKKRNINNTGYGTTYNCPADGYGNNQGTKFFRQTGIQLLTKQEGLSNNTLTEIHQDKDGFYGWEQMSA